MNNIRNWDWRSRAYETYKSTHLDSMQAVESVNREKIATLFRQFDLSPDAKICDIGCGKGQLLSALRDIGCVQVSGVDLSPENVAHCVQQGLQVEKCDGISYLKDASGQNYDAIFLFDIVEHLYLDEVINLLDIARKRLNKNGKVFIKTINSSNILAARDLFMDVTHVTGFTEYSMKQIAGITNLRFDGYFKWCPSGLGGGVRRYLWRAIHVVLYRLSGSKCPENTDREFIVVLKKEI